MVGIHSTTSDEGAGNVVKFMVACSIVVFGMLQTPEGLWPFLLLPVWLVWEVPAVIAQLRFSRDVQRDWEELVSS